VLLEESSIGIGFVALADTGFHNGRIDPVDVALFTATAIPVFGTAARAGKPLAQAGKAAQLGLGMGNEALAATHAAAQGAMQSAVQSKGYDSAKVNSDGSVTVKGTQTGSHIPTTTTCTSAGCK
jgi:hypothetical protein